MFKFALTFCLFLLISASPEFALAASKYSVSNYPEEGVNKTVFQIKDTGTITLILPLELVPGDNVSGSIILKPFGLDKAQKETNQKELQTYSLELRRAEIIPTGELTTEQQKKGLPAPKATSGSNTFSGKIPENCKSLEVTLLLGERKKKYKRLKLKETPEIESPEAGSYDLPFIAQGNHPTIIRGAFDGLADNTRVTVDGVNCKILAESPREVVFKSPISIVGKAKLVFKDGSKRGEGSFANLKLRLQAKKLKLKMGEKTQLYVKVEGIGDTKSPVELVLKNLTPKTISVIGGDEQVVQIPAGGQ